MIARALCLAAALTATPAAADRVDEAVIGVSRHILLHEVAHLLIDRLDLPVLGQEEDAADNFATLVLIALNTPEADKALAETAATWLLREYEGEEEGDGFFFSEHAPDPQRAFRILCHLVGVDQEFYGPLASDLGVFTEDLEGCEPALDLAARSWAQVLAPHAPDVSSPVLVTVEYRPAGEILARYEAMARRERLLEWTAAIVSRTARVPGPVTLAVARCGDANAYYTPDTGEVTLCYELMDDISFSLGGANP